MSLSAAQSAAIRAAIAGDPSIANVGTSPDENAAIAAVLDLPAVPDFYVLRTSVDEDEFTGTSGADVANGNAATNWSWPRPASTAPPARTPRPPP
jgi:hypothetical protein